MPARDARNAVRSSVLTQADVHFEAFSAGRRAPAELGLPSPALEFVGTDDAAGEAGRRLLRPVVLRGGTRQLNSGHRQSQLRWCLMR